MKQFAKLSKLIKLEQQNEVAQSFVNDLLYTIEKDNSSDYIPTKSYKPSGISGCKRSLYYQLTGAEPDGTVDSVNLVGICESGTDRHEIIQRYITHMKDYNVECEWVDVAQYLKQQGITNPGVVSRNGYETKLFNSEYNMRFLCDGLVKYKGEYYIIEIKTESTHKYNNHTEPFSEHKLQSACYAMNLQVPRVIFIYENRDNCDKKGYLFEVPEAMMDKVKGIIGYVNQCVETNTLPPKELDKCTYCKYKNMCTREMI